MKSKTELAIHYFDEHGIDGNNPLRHVRYNSDDIIGFGIVNYGGYIIRATNRIRQTDGIRILFSELYQKERINKIKEILK
jgi:hypothetical protein